MPQRARPPDRTSSVAIDLASSPMGRRVIAVTSVPRLTRDVLAAIHASAVPHSSMGSQSRPTCGIWRRWSMTHTLSKPARLGGHDRRSEAIGDVVPREGRHVEAEPHAGRPGRPAATSGEDDRRWAGTRRTGSGRSTRSKPSSSSRPRTWAQVASCCLIAGAGSGVGGRPVAGSALVGVDVEGHRHARDAVGRGALAVARPAIGVEGKGVDHGRETRESRCSTMVSSSAKASAVASRSSSP